MVSDKLGRPLEVGDYIAYGLAHINGAIRVGKILGFETINHRYYRSQKLVTITVQGVDGSRLTKQPGRLSYCHRIVKLNKDDIPVEIRRLLGDA